MTHTSLERFTADQLATVSVQQLCAGLCQQVSSHYGQALPIFVGIRRGGFYLAEWLHKELKANEPLGALDISWHRDDLRASSVTPNVKPTTLPVDIDGREVLLVDDVLFTGRTIRAALNELFDYGRPAAVRLAVLGQRQGRQLPIEADFVSCEFDLPATQQVKLCVEPNAPLAEWTLNSDAGDERCS